MTYIKKGYITERYVSEIEKRLYNDLPLEPFLDSVLPLDTVGDDNLDDILKPKEKYHRLPYDFNHVIVTSLGRVINLKTIKMYSPRIGNSAFHMYIGTLGVRKKYKLDMEDIFLSEGWDYDYKRLKQNYLDNKWRCTFYKK